jgi:hypothetical protein
MSAVDKIIAEAQEEDLFKDLPGKGKPLTIDPSPDAVVKSILKQANVSMAPEWITLASEIDDLLGRMEHDLEAYSAEAAAGLAVLTEAGSRTERLPEPPPADRSRTMENAKTRRGEVREGKERQGWVPQPFQRLFAFLALSRFRVLLRERGVQAETPTAAATGRRSQAVAAFHRRWDQALAQYAGRLHECNRKIRRFNQLVPVVNRQRRLLPVGERLEGFVERFPRLERAVDGSYQSVPGVVPAALLEPPAESGPATRQRDVVEAVALQRMRQMGRRPPPIG